MSNFNKKKLQDENFLEGLCLAAMPNMGDPRFDGAVVYICVHNADGAMGIIVNKHIEQIDFAELLEQLEIPVEGSPTDVKVRFGGPVETVRGFILHTTDYIRNGTVAVNNDIAMTATVDILRDIATGAGPDRYLLALGYAGWTAGQLESEICDNAWLTLPADFELLFSSDDGRKWDMALSRIGVDPLMLSSTAGTA